jgi:hypothetical protein
MFTLRNIRTEKFVANSVRANNHKPKASCHVERGGSRTTMRAPAQLKHSGSPTSVGTGIEGRSKGLMTKRLSFAESVKCLPRATGAEGTRVGMKRVAMREASLFAAALLVSAYIIVPANAEALICNFQDGVISTVNNSNITLFSQVSVETMEVRLIDIDRIKGRATRRRDSRCRVSKLDCWRKRHSYFSRKYSRWGSSDYRLSCR